jgi:hypothetical protein
MRNLIITTVAVFLLNFLTQAGIDYFFAEKNGDIIIADPIKTDSLGFSQTIFLSNYQKKSIENLEFYTKNGSIIKVLSNNTLKIKILSDKKFIIEKIYPSSTATVQIDFINPNINNIDEPYVLPLNHEDFSIAFQKASELKKQALIDWRSILINSLFVSIVFAVTMNHFDKRVNKLSQNLDAGIVERKELKAELALNLEKAEKTAKELRSTVVKLRMLLMAKARDLKTENDFYRNLISSMIKNGEKHEEEKIHELVQQHFKTYSTNADFIKEFETIEVIAHIVKKGE